MVNNDEELLELLTKLIPPNSLVGVGDSMTLFETGVIDFLRRGNYIFLDKYREGITREKKGRFTSRIFLLIPLCAVQTR